MKKTVNAKNLAFCALCIALCVVLPMAFHAIANAGMIFLPMHIPVPVSYTHLDVYKRQEIGFRIPNAGGVLADTVHDLFDVHGGDLFKAQLHEAGGLLRIPPDLDCGAAVHSDLQHNLHPLIKLHPVILLSLIHIYLPV